jgi:L-ascorbate metabolism protein UlaG (beta-lactamase superfamily)
MTFLGVAGYEVAGPSFRFLVDPFLSGPVSGPDADALEAPDVILVSHAAYDHLGDTARIAKRTGAPVICGGEVRAMLMEDGVPETQIQATTWGIVVEVNGIVVRPVECHHWSQGRLKSGQLISGVPMGFIVETEPGVNIYHFGDTAIFSDLKLIGELYRPTVGILGCANPDELLAQMTGAGRMLTGEMSPTEAALAAEYLGVEVAVACHYYNPAQPDVQAFVDVVPEYDSTGQRQVVAPGLGDTLVLTATDDGVAVTVEQALPAG